MILYILLVRRLGFTPLFSAEDAKTLLQIFCRNVIGHTAGMYLFREYLRGTCGARVISCWMHVQTFRKTQDPERRLELFNAIRRLYLHPIITLPGPGCLSDIVALGKRYIIIIIMTDNFHIALFSN